MKHESHGDAPEQCLRQSAEKSNNKYHCEERGVMVWGAFLAAGIGDLLHCEKSFNALENRKVLQNGLLLTTEKLSKAK